MSSVHESIAEGQVSGGQDWSLATWRVLTPAELDRHRDVRLRDIYEAGGARHLPILRDYRTCYLDHLFPGEPVLPPPTFLPFVPRLNDESSGDFSTGGTLLAEPEPR
jgi:hypothetical protein